MLNRRLILIELNELTPSLIFRFMGEGKLPHFQRLYDESRVFVTDAGEEGLVLNPWIQWVTVHTGVPFAQHGIFLLGEGSKVREPILSDIVSAAGKCAWQCGSMNVPVRSSLRGGGIPDPWATEASPHPTELEPYFRLVSRSVQEHTNESAPLAARDYLEFVGFMLSHGLSLSTAVAIIRQLLKERSGRYGWQRVAILEWLQWDVFRHYYQKLNPDFSTFFTNSVAHLQHAHWRNLEPEKFKIQPRAEEQEEFEEAILFGYQTNDQIIGRFLDLAGADCTLVFCTALSQQPCLEWEDQHGKRFYRPKDFGELTAFAGIDASHQCAPVMSEEFWVEFEDEVAARDGERSLAALRVGDREAFTLSRKGCRIYAGCSIFDELKSDAYLVSEAHGARRPFFDLLYESETTKSGVHHPDGMLWIRTPERTHCVSEERVPLTAVAPTVLHLLGLAPPPSMRVQSLL